MVTPEVDPSVVSIQNLRPLDLSPDLKFALNEWDLDQRIIPFIIGLHRRHGT
jgi:hypothetical protein